MNPLTGVLAEAWTLYRRYAVHFLTIAFLLYLVTAIIVALFAVVAGAGGLAVAQIIDLVAAFLVQAALIKAVQDVRDGRVDLSIGATVRAALPFLLPVTLAGLLAAIGISIGLVLFIVPGLVLLTFWSLIVPSIVVGGSGPMAAFGQSWRTIRGYAWHAFATYLLVFLLWVAFSVVLGVILFVVPVAVHSFISSIVGGTLVAPFYALVVTLAYYRLSDAHAGVTTAGSAGGGFSQPTAPPPPAGPVPNPGAAFSAPGDADFTQPFPPPAGGTAGGAAPA